MQVVVVEVTGLQVGPETPVELPLTVKENAPLGATPLNVIVADSGTVVVSTAAEGLVTAIVGEATPPSSGTTWVAAATFRLLSVEVRVPVTGPREVGSKLMESVQIAPAATLDAGQVEAPLRTKPAEGTWVVKTSGSVPLFPIVRNIGLSELMVLAAVEVKVIVGGVWTLISFTAPAEPAKSAT